MVPQEHILLVDGRDRTSILGRALLREPQIAAEDRSGNETAAVPGPALPSPQHATLRYSRNQDAPKQADAGPEARAGPASPGLACGALLRLALPSILLKSGAPLAITFQTALIGRKATELLAAWASVAMATNAATVLFNFLVSGVTAKVSKAVAAGAWGRMGARIRLALAMTGLMALAECLLLLALQGPPWSLLHSSSPLVLNVVGHYFYLRVAGVLPQLLVMCASGILQGYKRVNLVAALQGARVLLDVLGSYASLYILDWGLTGVGIGTILASSTVALAGLTCVVLLPQAEATHRIHIFSNSGCTWVPWRLSGGNAENVTAYVQMPADRSDGIAPAEPDFVESMHAGDAGAGAGAGEGAEADGLKERTLSSTGGCDAGAAGAGEGAWQFIWDGMSTAVRNMVIQTSSFLVLGCAASLGMYALAAHQVIMQLWMINICIGGGLGTAGTIVCSSLAGQLERAGTRHSQQRCRLALRIVTWRLLLLGLGAGLCLSGVYWALEETLIGVFTSNEKTREELHCIWPFLVAMQPLNSIVFVTDGLISAAQAFSYMAACLAVGFIAVVFPCFALAYLYLKTLAAAWSARGILNVIRFAVASNRVHAVFLRPSAPRSASLPLGGATSACADGDPQRFSATAAPLVPQLKSAMGSRWHQAEQGLLNACAQDDLSAGATGNISGHGEAR